jgi:hypothetical protein
MRDALRSLPPVDSEVHAALEALDALPAPDAHATLSGLLKRHGLRY